MFIPCNNPRCFLSGGSALWMMGEITDPFHDVLKRAIFAVFTISLTMLIPYSGFLSRQLRAEAQRQV